MSPGTGLCSHCVLAALWVLPGAGLVPELLGLSCPGAAPQGWGTSGFWDLCQDLFDKRPELQEHLQIPTLVCQIPHTCPRTHSKAGWSSDGVDEGDRVGWSGAALPVWSRDYNVGKGGCEPWALQLPTPRCGALGSGVLAAEPEHQPQPITCHCHPQQGQSSGQ